MPEPREVIARALCPGCGGHGNDCGADNCRAYAGADAALSALRAAGYAAVPVEATEEMRQCGAAAYEPKVLEYANDTGNSSTWDDCAEIWRAMVGAARGAGGAGHE